MLSAEIDRQISWPQQDLERLGACPCCQRRDRHILFGDLSDRVFGVAPGSWTSWQCDNCGVAYLDPRPSPESIGRAYESYYTHDLPSWSRRGPIARVRGMAGEILRNRYLNHRFGHALKPSYFVGQVGPARAFRYDYYVRWLPPPKRAGARLLEIGPGDGRFLRLAQRLGYSAEGLEPDPKATELCRQSGLLVHEGPFPQTAIPENTFEHILLSHVFEHLHYPVAAVEAIWNALVPGGRLWMAMPNLHAAGLQRWGRNWIALDPPRHLVLYDRPSLERLLRGLGFHRIEFLHPEFGREFNYRASRQIELGEIALSRQSLESRGKVPADIARAVLLDNRAQERDCTLSEDLIVAAYKSVTDDNENTRVNRDGDL